MTNLSPLKIGEKIKLLRKSKGLSQGNIAEAMFSSIPFVSRLENGQIECSEEFLCEIKKILDMESAPLMKYELELYRDKLLVANDMITANRIADAKEMLNQVSSIMDLPFEYDMRLLYMMVETRVLFRENNIAAADQRLKEAEALIKKASDKTTYIYHCNKGVQYSMKHDLKSSLKHQLQALEFTDGKKPDVLLMANIGTTYTNMGKCHRAIQYLERAKEDYYGDRANNLGAMINGLLAACYCRIGDYDKATALLDTSIPQARSTGDVQILGHLLLYKGTVSGLSGDYEKAIDFFDQTQECSKDSIEYSMHYVFAAYSKVHALSKLRRLDECHETLERARPMAEGNEMLTILLNTAGHLLNLNNSSASSYIEDVAIPYLRAFGGLHSFVAVDLYKELESHYKRKRSKMKALEMSHAIREIYEELFF